MSHLNKFMIIIFCFTLSACAKNTDFHSVNNTINITEKKPPASCKYIDNIKVEENNGNYHRYYVTSSHLIKHAKQKLSEIATKTHANTVYITDTKMLLGGSLSTTYSEKALLKGRLYLCPNKRKEDQ